MVQLLKDCLKDISNKNWMNQIKKSILSLIYYAKKGNAFIEALPFLFAILCL